jgi:hypothetical protein
VVTLDEYLDILQRKIIAKKNGEEIKESKRKKKEEKQNRTIIVKAL